jgi:hypothetical protein
VETAVSKVATEKQQPERYRQPFEKYQNLKSDT